MNKVENQLWAIRRALALQLGGPELAEVDRLLAQQRWLDAWDKMSELTYHHHKRITCTGDIWEGLALAARSLIKD